MVLTQLVIGSSNDGRKELRFHTTMVLTQREHRVGETLMPTRFHTTMVLTQLATFTVRIQCIYVSIPLWFLRNSRRMTQYKSASGSFHTTMVLTQQ